jgi:hypothetical protein
MTLTPEQHRIYFEVRLNGQKIAATDRDITVRCPFHDDKTASLSGSEDPIWACLRWLGRGDRIDGMDGNFCDAFLCWCGLELRKCYSGRD